MVKIGVLDRFINKHFCLEVSDEQKKALHHWDKLVYLVQDKSGEKESIGTYIEYFVSTDENEGTFLKKIEGKELEEFNKQHAFALKVFPIFKEQFQAEFAGSVPVTARYNHLTDQIYFYFYSEERYVFSDFVKKLREQLWKNIFIYQVGARDRVRMDPRTDGLMCGSSQIPMYCKTYQPLPSIDIEDILLQHLEGRDIERLKGRCWKLRCDLMYELETYKRDSKHYPSKGEKVRTKDGRIKGMVLSFNILNQSVMIRTEDAIFRLPMSEIVVDKEKKEKTV